MLILLRLPWWPVVKQLPALASALHHERASWYPFSVTTTYSSSSKTLVIQTLCLPFHVRIDSDRSSTCFLP
jgi:hypothetical protein